jgi:hypothetical protein
MSCCAVGLTDLTFCRNIIPEPLKFEGTIFLGNFKFCEPCYTVKYPRNQNPEDGSNCE